MMGGMSTARAHALEDQEEHPEDALTPEERAELEVAFEEAEQDLRAGRCVSVEQFCAERGIPWRPATG
jgi:hypothetical protein